jgi:hypothetical protein
MGDVVLADPQGQNPLPIDSVRLDEAFYNALDNETTIWPEPRWPEEIESSVTLRPVGLPRQDERELAWRAAVAEPGSLTPGVAVNNLALRHPQLILPSDNHGATASGQSPQKILTEVSAGTNLMAACKAAYYICYGI